MSLVEYANAAMERLRVRYLKRLKETDREKWLRYTTSRKAELRFVLCH